MTYANVMTVAAEIGRPITSADEIAQVNAWLTRANLTIRARIKDLDELVAAGEIDSEAVASVEAAAVARKVHNPRGLRSTLVSIDDGSIQETTDSSQSDGAIRILDAEWELLIPAGRGGAFSIRMTATPESRFRDPWPLGRVR